mgnify:CR=1 FL=1
MFMLPTISLRIERWKFNKDYGVYVSTLGNFKDRHKRNLPVKIYQTGYCVVKTECPQPWVLAHRLVMFTWKPIPNAENLTVDHLNHNKRDNSLANLEWVTYEENQRRAAADFIRSTPTVAERKAQSERDKARQADKDEIAKERKAARQAYKARILGYSIDGEGCYTKQEAIERLVAMRGENSRKLTKKAFNHLEDGTNQTGQKTFGQHATKHIVKVIFKDGTN